MRPRDGLERIGGVTLRAHVSVRTLPRGSRLGRKRWSELRLGAVARPPYDAKIAPARLLRRGMNALVSTSGGLIAARILSSWLGAGHSAGGRVDRRPRTRCRFWAAIARSARLAGHPGRSRRWRAATHIPGLAQSEAVLRGSGRRNCPARRRCAHHRDDASDRARTHPRALSRPRGQFPSRSSAALSRSKPAHRHAARRHGRDRWRHDAALSRRAASTRATLSAYARFLTMRHAALSIGMYGLRLLPAS